MLELEWEGLAKAKEKELITGFDVSHNVDNPCLLLAHRHEGFWQCMDTLRDKRSLEKLWESGDAPWKIRD